MSWFLLMGSAAQWRPTHSPLPHHCPWVEIICCHLLAQLKWNTWVLWGHKGKRYVFPIAFQCACKTSGSVILQGLCSGLDLTLYFVKSTHWILIHNDGIGAAWPAVTIPVRVDKGHAQLHYELTVSVIFISSAENPWRFQSSSKCSGGWA